MVGHGSGKLIEAESSARTEDPSKFLCSASTVSKSFYFNKPLNSVHSSSLVEIS